MSSRYIESLEQGSEGFLVIGVANTIYRLNKRFVVSGIFILSPQLKKLLAFETSQCAPVCDCQALLRFKDIFKPLKISSLSRFKNCYFFRYCFNEFLACLFVLFCPFVCQAETICDPCQDQAYKETFQYIVCHLFGPVGFIIFLYCLFDIILYFIRSIF